jgi:adenosylhomocysteine nucleosidase
MLLVAAALAEELNTALNLCASRRKVRCAGVPAWTGTRAGKTLHFLKLGAGPARSAGVLERALAVLKATRILVIGYAGALDPGLKQGDLVVVERADLLSEDTWGDPLSEMRLGDGWELTGAEDIFLRARAAGLPVHLGTALTSPCIMGAPEHKDVLFRKFHAAIVDMETASLARVAAAASVPLSCVRSISDEARDDFLACLSYDPEANPLQRAAKVVGARRWLSRYSQWRDRSRVARQSLARLLSFFLDDVDV